MHSNFFQFFSTLFPLHPHERYIVIVIVTNMSAPITHEKEEKKITKTLAAQIQ